MAKRAEDRKTYSNVGIDYFVQKCRTIDQGGLNVNLKSENPGANGSVWFRVLHGMSMASYGEKITITLTPVGAGTDVHILSECGMPTQIVDYGKNRQNCAAIFAYFDRGIEAANQYAGAQPQPQPQPMPQPQPQPQPMPQPMPQPQPQPMPVPTPTPQPVQTNAQAAMAAQYAAQDFVFCMECGTKNSKGSNFCMKCGARLMIP